MMAALALAADNYPERGGRNLVTARFDGVFDSDQFRCPYLPPQCTKRARQQA
jgi:hypothetical protein